MVLAVINVGVGLMVGALWLGVWLGWAGWVTRWQAPPQAREWRRARCLLTGGGAALALHAFMAFDNFHNWSHEMAGIAMELRTREFLPVQTSAAIYFTYLYLAVWAVEILWSWLGLAAWQRRPRWVDGGVQGFLHFYGVVLILFLGGVGAHHLPPWPVGALAVAAVGALTWRWLRFRGAGRAAEAAGT